MSRHELLTEREMADLRQIDVLLDEANKHAMTLGDGGWKSNEGGISVSLGNHWERDSEEDRKPAQVEVYSYLLGPHRSHYFDSTAQALDVVKEWHKREMAHDYTTHKYNGHSELDPYLVLEQERHAAMDEAMRQWDEEMGGQDADLR